MTRMRRVKPLSYLTGRERALMGIGLGLLMGSFAGFFASLVVGPLDTLMRGVFCLIVGSFFTFLLYFADHRRSRWRLVDRDFRVCMYCGYDLRSTEPPGPCPECGEIVDTFAMRNHWEKRYPEWKEQRD